MFQEVTVTLTFDRQNLISSSFSPSECCEWMPTRCSWEIAFTRMGQMDNLSPLCRCLWARQWTPGCGCSLRVRWCLKMQCEVFLGKNKCAQLTSTQIIWRGHGSQRRKIKFKKRGICSFSLFSIIVNDINMKYLWVLDCWDIRILKKIISDFFSVFWHFIN